MDEDGYPWLRQTMLVSEWRWLRYDVVPLHAFVQKKVSHPNDALFHRNSVRSVCGNASKTTMINIPLLNLEAYLSSRSRRQRNKRLSVQNLFHPQALSTDYCTTVRHDSPPPITTVRLRYLKSSNGCTYKEQVFSNPKLRLASWAKYVSSVSNCLWNFSDHFR